MNEAKNAVTTWAVGVFEDGTLGPCPDGVETEQLRSMLDVVEFEGKHGETTTLPADPGTRINVVGLGEELSTEGLRQAAGALGKLASGEVVTALHQLDIEEATRAVVEGFRMGAYQFDRYKSGNDAGAAELVLAGDHEAGAVSSAEVVARAVTWARDLVNIPARDKAPAEIVEMVHQLPGQLQVDVYDEDRLREDGFGGILGVSAGADREPRLLDVGYTPDDPHASLAFVGKGVVFDSGGLSIKTSSGMETMKSDMAGAATVLAAISALAELGAPVAVRAVTPLVENMTGGSATRPGDVLTIYGGKTVEVLNTDAEGRLILGDALELTSEDDHDLVVDVATLTGAMKVGLGVHYGGLFTDDEDLADRILMAAEAAGESMWRMPIDQRLRENIDSEVADVTNKPATRHGGAIHGALFLKEFVGDSPWAHLDIAGPAWSTKKQHYLEKGGTGFGVRTLIEIGRSFTASNSAR